MRSKSIYITFDLGIKGDYSGLFSWLDDNKAVECGNGIAFLKFKTSSVNYDDIFNELKEQLSEAIEISNNDRIYAIVRDEATNLVKGRFIFGSRRQAPWIGYGKAGFSELADSE